MDTLDAPMMCAVAYWLDMCSLAAMSIVDCAWNALLSDCRVRNATRMRCLRYELPSFRAHACESLVERREHWFHLAAIAREFRLHDRCLRRGYEYLQALFGRESDTTAAWRALDTVFQQLRDAVHESAVDSFGEKWGRDARGWAGEPKGRMYSDRRDGYQLVGEQPGFLQTFATYRASYVVITPGSEHGTKRRRRATFADHERQAFMEFVAYCHECVEMWRLYCVSMPTRYLPQLRRARALSNSLRLVLVDVAHHIARCATIGE